MRSNSLRLLILLITVSLNSLAFADCDVSYLQSYYQLDISMTKTHGIAYSRFAIDNSTLDIKVSHIYQCYLQSIEKRFGYLPSAKQLVELESINTLKRYPNSEGALKYIAELESDLTATKIYPVADKIQKFLFAAFSQLYQFNFANEYEFAAITLSKGDKTKVFFASDLNRPLMGVSLSQFQSEIKSLTNKGWKLTAHYHNHPFTLRDGLLGGGIVFPSSVDQQSSVGWKQEIPGIQSIVTNGIQYSKY